MLGIHDVAALEGDFDVIILHIMRSGKGAESSGPEHYCALSKIQ